MRPVELIISNVTHDIAEKLARFPAALSEISTPDTIMEALARDILSNIASDARLDVVMKAIAAAGGPGDAGELSARFKAVQDMHRTK